MFLVYHLHVFGVSFACFSGIVGQDISVDCLCACVCAFDAAIRRHVLSSQLENMQMIRKHVWALGPSPPPSATDDPHRVGIP